MRFEIIFIQCINGLLVIRREFGMNKYGGLQLVVKQYFNEKRFGGIFYDDSFEIFRGFI